MGRHALRAPSTVQTKIIHLVEDRGLTGAEAAQRLGFTRQYIYKVLKRWRPDLSAGEYREPHSAQLIFAMRVLWHFEWSARAIGECFGLTRNAVIGVADRHEFPARRRPSIRRAA